jgi:hypothetical protein
VLADGATHATAAAAVEVSLSTLQRALREVRPVR